MLIWIALILLAAAGLTIGIERLMSCLNIHPERPEERAGGMRDVLERIVRWSRRQH